MLRIPAVAVVMCLAITSCGSSTKKAVNELGARAAAETMRGALKANALEPDETVRDVSVLRDAADKIPGSPTVTGINDANHDGKDDDGNVDISIGDQHACLTAKDNGRVDVTDGAC